MKKNKMMRLASFLLIAVLVSTSAISGTYAKYVSSNFAEDEARVAKWGVTVTASAADLFKDSYALDDTSASLTGNSVISAGGAEDEVVAPGTTGSVAAFDVDGEPEVSVRIKYTVDKFELTGWVVDSKDYCPLVFTVTRTEGSVTNTETFTNINDAAALATAVKTFIEGSVSEYEVREGFTGSDLVVSWSWPFETGANDVEKAANNIKDTALGNQADAGNAATVAIKVTCTVEQID